MLHEADRKDRVMAAHGAPEYSVAEGNDYPAHERTYQNFISLVKWVGGFVILIVIGMAIFLT
jgi:Bacterial aa3 type cytochrome c oxidase subunit IV